MILDPNDSGEATTNRDTGEMPKGVENRGEILKKDNFQI